MVGNECLFRSKYIVVVHSDQSFRVYNIEVVDNAHFNLLVDLQLFINKVHSTYLFCICSCSTSRVIGNGDIFSYSEYKEKVLAHENLSPTAMLGRGALIKPWLPTEIKEKKDWDISASERLDILKDFVRNGLEHWGSDQQGVNNTRRFLLEWLSFLYRYVPVGLLEVLPQKMNQRPPLYLQGRNDLETLFLSPHAADWIKISEILMGPVAENFSFRPKHKSASYESNG